MNLLFQIVGPQKGGNSQSAATAAQSKALRAAVVEAYCVGASSVCLLQFLVRSICVVSAPSAGGFEKDTMA